MKDWDWESLMCGLGFGVVVIFVGALGGLVAGLLF